jgi:hypothetical protein
VPVERERERKEEEKGGRQTDTGNLVTLVRVVVEIKRREVAKREWEEKYTGTTMAHIILSLRYGRMETQFNGVMQRK